MTFNDLQQDVYRRLGFATASPDAATQTRVRAYLNETQQEILAEPGMGVLLNGSLTFASVADTPQYALPQAAAKIKTIYEITNDQKLHPRSLDWYRTVFPDTAAITGTPEYYVDMGFTSISTQPAAATEVFVDSTAAGDDATVTAYVEGYRTSGYFRSLSVAMNGTTGVSLSAAITDFVFLTKFYISAAAVGTVTLQTTAAGGTILATIPIGQTFARYRRFALAPTPSVAITYTIDLEYDLPSMANANDEPILPVKFHRLLGTGARMKEYEKQDQLQRYRVAQTEYLVGLRKLKFYMSGAAGTANLRGQRHGGISQLGPNYPAGS